MTKLIFACDVSDFERGIRIIDQVARYIDVLKVGIEAMTVDDDLGETLANIFCTRAQEEYKQIMWDMKLHDVGHTMQSAARNLVRMEVDFFTLHATASDTALRQVVQVTEGTDTMPLAVTVLTDLDDEQCRSRYCRSAIESAVLFAKKAWSFGINGFVCSAREVAAIKDALPDAFVVAIGIRPEWYGTKDEQKRTATPAAAKRSGADAIVVGRPIYQPTNGYSSRQAANLIQKELKAS